MGAEAVLGLQWGDEGKGKLVDLLAEGASYVIRGQGGNNAGHTLVAHDAECKLHLVPSGILHPSCRCYIGAGVVIDPISFLEEIEQLRWVRQAHIDQIRISPAAHLVLPHHRLLDRLAEERLGLDRIGTTGRGIGPCYADKARRIGVRVGDLLDPFICKEKIRSSLLANIPLIGPNERGELAHLDHGLDQFLDKAVRITRWIESLEVPLLEALARNERCLLEGAQGVLLDNSFGTYPYVTSSGTLPAALCAGAGIPPGYLKKVIGVAKAYTTRVGAGPFPTELSPDERKLFPSADVARERGTTTGRERRLGWFDAPLMKYAARMAGCEMVALTKLDILDEVRVLRIAISHGSGEGECIAPHQLAAHPQLHPRYEEIEGWLCSTAACRSWDQLPVSARRYIERLEELCEVRIGIVSVGPKREQTLFREQQ